MRHFWRPRLAPKATRAQINEWLDECEHMGKMRAVVRFRCNCDDFESGCDCDGCGTYMRRIHIHNAINLRARIQSA